MIKADSTHQDSQPVSKAFFTLLLSTVLAAYLYVFMEWIFFVTTPSFLNSITTYQQFQVLFISAFISASVALLFAIFLFGMNLTLNFFGITKTFFLGQFVPSLILAGLFLLMLDNFTYTVLNFGIVSSGKWRTIYGWVLAGVFAYVYWWLTFNRGLAKNKQLRISLLAVTGILLIVSAGMMIGELRTAQKTRAGFEQSGLGARPNIVILGSDGVNARNMSLYGYDRETTPRITQLAQDSLVAENAYPNAGNSAGSITSMLTGKSPFQTRVVFPPNILVGKDAFEHLPGILRPLGYKSVQFGVPYYIDAYDVNMQGGFDIVNQRQIDEEPVLRFIRTLGLENESYFITRLAERILGRLLHISKIKEMQNPYEIVSEPKEDLSNMERMDGMLNLLLASDQPVFIHAHLMETHGEYFYPSARMFSQGEEQTDKWMTDFYDDSILEFDDYVGHFVDTLSEAGVLDNTILIIYTDHNMQLGTSERVPLIFRFPNGQYKGRIQNNVQNLDLVPTILDYLSIPLPTWLDGQSLLRGEPPKHRLIISTRAVYAKNTDNGWLIDDARIKPPFNQFRYIMLIDCQKWYQLHFYDQNWTVGEVGEHTSTCSDEDLLSFDQLKAEAFQYLKEHGFDISPLVDRPYPIYTPTPAPL